MLELILDVCINFSKEIKDVGIKDEQIINIMRIMKCCTYYLFSKNFISIKSIIEKSVTDPVLFVYFYPEIDEYDHEYAEKVIYNIQNDSNETLSQFSDFVIKNPEIHKEYRKNHFNPTQLHKTIRNDDIDEFQSLLSKNNYSYNHNFDFSYYERTLTECKTPSLIQIAATYGSIKIFKFLWMQNDIIYDDNLICYAISGRNYEIIHICEEKCSKSRALRFSINSHQHELTDYFIDNINDDDEQFQKDDELEDDDEDNVYSKLSNSLIHVAYQCLNYQIILPCLKKIVHILDDVEENKISTDNKTYLGSSTFDFDLFKFVYSHKNKNIDLYNGYYPIYLQWIYNGMIDAINYVIPNEKPNDILFFFKTSLDVNISVSNFILDLLIEKKLGKEVFDYFMQNIDFYFFLSILSYYNEDLITKVNKLFVKIDDVPYFLDELQANTSVKFINSLFKRKLEFDVDNSVVEDELKKNKLEEALLNFQMKKTE
ncbi:hypothetical protein M9Y10_039726 [Tritrichomonas musculus]|uniref:DUF3447 domain-containing protein n=1 Tax=Tritrichomonas musculus TaxID=1915356 RepID=A0ABR2GR10_9EUKA